MNRFSYVLLLSALAGLNQPVTAASNGTVIASKTQPQQKNLPDAQIERTIKAKLAKSKLSADHFTVSVQNGVATIEGSTNVLQHKGVMTRMARTSGATAVRNNIRVSDAAKAKAAQGLAKNKVPAEVPRAAVVTPGNTTNSQAGHP